MNIFLKLKKTASPIIIALFEIFIYFQITLENPQLTLKYKLVLLITCVLANVVIFFICKYLNNKEKVKIENLFLVITILFGSLYLIFIPAILGTDEVAHFLRGYQISAGDIIVKNPEKNDTKIPKSLYDIVFQSVMADRYSKNMIFKSVNYKDTINLLNGHVTSINYSPIPYIPQVIGFWIARLLKLSPLLTLYLIRFINFSTYVTLAYFAFKLLPTKNLFALIFYTCPAILSIVSTCNIDAFSLGTFLLLIAYILNLTKTKRELNKKDYIILTLLSLGISTYKVFYVLYTLLLFLIPIECFKGNTKKKFIYLSSIVMISIMLDLAWFLATIMGPKVGASTTTEQIKFILSNPFKYMFIYINTFIDNIYYYATNLIAGSEMCYGRARINQLFVISYIFILIWSYFDGSKKNNITLFGKRLIIFVSLAIFALVSTTLYLDWTSQKMGIGSLKIIGIQSRYFWVLIIPIVSILPTVKKKFKDEKGLIKAATIMNAIIMINCIGSLLVASFPN